ncbi:tigger transposable element-derived protein 4-like [Erpetoichthys calabaricus]|uniref:tigger transposable element-derived protein 4-like n=1 Tax=Erpetoichthys calabaricus TaxID=27687 RepID=UPI00109FBD6A|nr:tigger transposable element-derived protein 4-like [Erpetoichthys calabaricus]
MSRRDLTLAEKIDFLDQIRQQPPNTSQRRLVEITGLAKTTISHLLKQENELREEWAQCERRRGTSQKRKREGKDPDVDEALNEWFAIVTGRGVRVSGPMLKCKAEELAKKLGHNDFKATDGWLSRWKSRHDIKFKKAHGEKESADGAGAEKWKSTKLPEIHEKFQADNIYNADETGLYYRATPDGSLSYNHVALSGSKKVMDRVTVLCCSNMSGTDKRKLLVIGKSAKPRCFKGLKMDSLPVVYRASRNAWMTSELFKEWLKDWDRELQCQSRKVLLLLDNCAAHPRLHCLKNIQLEFLPPRTTALVQPMDMGIIKNLKIFYRARLVNYVLEATEENLLTSSSTATEVSAKVNVLQAVTFVADSWRKISSETIQNCFSHSGFRHLILQMDVDMPIESEKNDENVELQQVENYEEFLSIDNELHCYDKNEDYDASIVARIVAKHMTASEDQESNDDDPNELVQVTTQDARKCIEILCRYFMQEGNEGSPIDTLDVCGDFVQVQCVNRMRQITLDKFFKH